METASARSSWSTWLQKPSQWRWPSSKRLLALMAAMLAMMLVFEAVFLAGETQPFLMRMARQESGPRDTDIYHLRSSNVSSATGTNASVSSNPNVNVSAAIVAINVTESAIMGNGTGSAMRIQSSSINSTDTNSSIVRNASSNVASNVNVSQANVASTMCSPETIDPDTIEFNSHHELYSLLQMGLKYAPPVFEGDATSLCGNGEDRLWQYCLPISGSKDPIECHAKDQFDLMRPHTPATLCFNSALHMMLVDVYEEMKLIDVHPAILFGSLLGAVRDGLTIPFTEDADIGFNTLGEAKRMDKLKAKLATKGYHMFFHKIWRVCVAPTHPLASNLYNPDMELLRGPWDAPYVDLYEMKLQNETTYRVDEAKPDPMIPRERIEPFSQVTLHGRKYDTVADPEFLLKREYGVGYMTPKSRKQRAPRTRKPITSSETQRVNTTTSSS